MWVQTGVVIQHDVKTTVATVVTVGGIPNVLNRRRNWCAFAGLGTAPHQCGATCFWPAAGYRCGPPTASGSGGTSPSCPASSAGCRHCPPTRIAHRPASPPTRPGTVLRPSGASGSAAACAPAPRTPTSGQWPASARSPSSAPVRSFGLSANGSDRIPAEIKTQWGRRGFNGSDVCDEKATNSKYIEGANWEETKRASYKDWWMGSGEIMHCKFVKQSASSWKVRRAVVVVTKLWNDWDVRKKEKNRFNSFQQFSQLLWSSPERP